MHNMQSMLLGENPSGGPHPGWESSRTERDLATILTPDLPVTPIPTGVAGPLSEGSVRFVLGCSSLSFQGISVVPGVVDSDYTGEIKVLISLPTKSVQIKVKD